jgi:hypothetical protein
MYDPEDDMPTPSCRSICVVDGQTAAFPWTVSHQTSRQGQLSGPALVICSAIRYGGALCVSVRRQLVHSGSFYARKRALCGSSCTQLGPFHMKKAPLREEQEFCHTLQSFTTIRRLDLRLYRTHGRFGRQGLHLCQGRQHRSQDKH